MRFGLDFTGFGASESSTRPCPNCSETTVWKNGYRTDRIFAILIHCRVRDVDHNGLRNSPTSMWTLHWTIAPDGDIRVPLVLDRPLSAIFSAVAVWGLSVAGVLTFPWSTVGFATLAVAAITYLAVLP